MCVRSVNSRTNTTPIIMVWRTAIPPPPSVPRWLDQLQYCLTKSCHPTQSPIIHLTQPTSPLSVDPTPTPTQPHHTMPEAGDITESIITPLKQFAKDSMHLCKKCTKPDKKEFTAIAKATGIGFLIMGFIGFFVKLVHIPINNLLVGH